MNVEDPIKNIPLSITTLREIHGVGSIKERDFLMLAVIAIEHSDGLIKIKDEYFDLAKVNVYERRAANAFLYQNNIQDLFDLDSEQDSKEYHTFGKTIRSIVEFVNLTERLLFPEEHKKNRADWAKTEYSTHEYHTPPLTAGIAR